MPQDFVIRSGIRGVDHTVDSTLLADLYARDMVNIVIEDGMLRTRGGVKIHDLGIKAESCHAAIIHTPSRGQSVQSYTSEAPSIVISADGVLHSIKLTDACVGESEVSCVEDISDGKVLDKNQANHWLTSAENYLIASDGVSATLIRDDQTRTSNGMGRNSGDESEIPNYATAHTFAHGMLFTTHDGNQIVAGDPIGNKHVSTAEDILSTTQHLNPSYYASLSPPSSIGPILAMDKLGANDSTHGHSRVIAHGLCGGIWGINPEFYPRQTEVDANGNIQERGWRYQRMTSVLSDDSSAVSPRAIEGVSGDQIYRDQDGLKSLRGVIGEQNFLGDPHSDLSERVRDIVKDDPHHLLILSSVKKWKTGKRVFMSTGMTERGGRGYLSMNLQPLDVDQSNPVWEGLHVLPDGYDNIQHFVSGRYGCRDRMFAITSDDCGNLFLVEFSDELARDILPNGKEREIEWQILSRKVVSGNITQPKTFTGFSAFFRRIAGKLSYDIQTRSDSQTCWKEAKKGEICGGGSSGGELKDAKQARDSFPTEQRSSRWVQFLVRGEGRMHLESLTLSFEKDSESSNFKDSKIDCCLDCKDINLYSYGETCNIS